jgi:hypothetical protein
MRKFEASEGKVLYADDLANELDVYRDTVQAGVNNLRRKPEWDAAIEIVVRGNAWRYKGPAGEVKANGHAPDGAGLMFTSLASTREGDLILQCEDGRIFRAKEL